MPTKENDKREIDETASFDEGFKKGSIEQSAELDIKPKLELPEAGESVQVVFSAEPRKVMSAKLPNGQAWFIDVFHDDMEKSIVIPNSLRYSLNVLKAKGKWAEFKGKTVSIIAEIGTMPDFPHQKTYKAVEVSS